MFHRKLYIYILCLDKYSIEPHQNFTVSYEKNVEVLDEVQDTQNIKR